MEDLIKALQILLKYTKDKNEQSPTHCEHDIIYVGKDLKPEDMSMADSAELERLGFMWDEIVESWYSYRFGSA